MRIVTLGLGLGLALGFVLPALTPAAAQAQKRWKEIGKTSAGNTIFVDTRSVKTSKGITSALMEVKFTKPVPVKPGVVWYLSKHDVMFDCGKHYVASKS